MEFFQEQYFKVELQINIEIYKSINNWLFGKFSSLVERNVSITVEDLKIKGIKRKR